MTVVFHVGGDGGSITVTSNMEKNNSFQTLCEKSLISEKSNLGSSVQIFECGEQIMQTMHTKSRL